MGKGFEIGVGVDTKAAKQAIDSGLVAPFEDAQKELLELGRSRGPGMLERSLEDAQDATKKLERETREAADAIEDEYRRAYRVQKQSAEDASRAGSSATSAFKDEAKQNFAEVASSFDGSMQGIADGIQGTLGGLAIGIGGGLGIALASLGALGGSFAQQWADAAQATEDRIAGMYEDMLESGQRYLSQDYLNQQLATLYEDQTKYNDAVKTAKALGLDLQTVLIAEVTAGQERNQVLERADQLRRDALENAKAGADYTDAEAAAAAQLADKYADMLDHYQSLNGEQSNALQKATEIGAAQDKINAQFAEGERVTGNVVKNLQAAATTKVIVPIDADTSELEKKLGKSRTVRVTLEGYTRNGQKVI